MCLTGPSTSVPKCRATDSPTRPGQRDFKGQGSEKRANRARGPVNPLGQRDIEKPINTGGLVVESDLVTIVARTIAVNLVTAEDKYYTIFVSLYCMLNKELYQVSVIETPLLLWSYFLGKLTSHWVNPPASLDRLNPLVLLT